MGRRSLTFRLGKSTLFVSAYVSRLPSICRSVLGLAIS